MIEVKEAKEAKEARAAAPFRINVPIESKAEGWNDPYAFRDPAEMVTISADRFERMVRENDDLRVRLTSYENQLNAVSSFVDQEAMKYAQKGRELPSWEDAYKVGELIHWTEPSGIRYVRLDVEQTAKTIQEVKENGEAAD